MPMAMWTEAEVPRATLVFAVKKAPMNEVMEARKSPADRAIPPLTKTAARNTRLK